MTDVFPGGWRKGDTCYLITNKAIAAEIVLRLRERDPRLRLIAALPYPSFGRRWSGGTKNTLDFARKQRVPCVVIDTSAEL